MRWCAVALAIMAGTLVAPAPAHHPHVRVEGGRLAGTRDGSVEAFKGIPFAAPPIGALRWRAPQAAVAWQGVRAAADYGHDCVQDYHADIVPPGSDPAEDCLYLNVWRPQGARKALPVMVWIYGGGFVNGSASRPIYSGVRLARQGIIVVSFNYRLGRFGTFAHPALTRADADHGVLANYGYMDQIAALAWIRRNIAAVGGDLANVTIVGESAGGMSVHNLLTSPMAQGLFARAVVASGGDGSAIAGKTLAEAEAIGATFGRTQGIAPDDPDALARLRAIPAAAVLGGITLATVLTPGPRAFSSPFPDGRVAVDAATAYRAGTFQHVPLMIGATSGDLGGRDGLMIKGARSLAGLISKAGVPTYYYRFSYVAQAAPTSRTNGAIHADDLPYYFDTVDVKYRDRTLPADRKMGRLISGYLVNFVKTGNPNGGSLPTWRAYRSPDGTMMDFAANGAAEPGKDAWSAPTTSAPRALTPMRDIILSANGH